jgi:hypothetical protein
MATLKSPSTIELQAENRKLGNLKNMSPGQKVTPELNLI